MLVFKDSILGFVAAFSRLPTIWFVRGLGYASFRRRKWHCTGDYAEYSQNSEFDNTISAIPPYTLVTVLFRTGGNDTVRRTTGDEEV